MNEETPTQDQPTNEQGTTSSTEVSNGAYSEPAPENTAGGEESPPNTVGNAVIIEKDPDQSPDDAVTTARDGSPDQTATTHAPAQAPTTVEQVDSNTATTGTIEEPAKDTQTESIVSVESQPKSVDNTSKTDFLGSAAIIATGIVAGGVSLFRHRKKT